MEIIYVIGAVLTFFYELSRKTPDRGGFLPALICAAIWPVAWVFGLIMIIAAGIFMRRE